MKLTVLMPVYNAEKYLKEAIESILHQTYADFEFLIIDDGSTDKSLEIIKSYSDPMIRLITHEQNKKLIATLNEGIALAQGEYIARMDADDISGPDRLKIQMDFMEKNPEVILCGSDFKVIDELGREIGFVANPIQDKLIRKYFTVQNSFGHGSVIFKKEAAQKAGGYEADKYLIEDYSLWIKMANLGQIANIAQPLYFWRSLPTSESGTKWQLMNQNADKLRTEYWDTFGPQGPLPMDKANWELIQKELALDNSDWRKKMIIGLLVQLADQYARRGHNKIKRRLLFAALKLKPSFKYSLFLILALILPGGWILKAKSNAFLYKKLKKNK